MERALDVSAYSVSSIPVPAAQPVDWAVEHCRAAVLVHDMQRYFMNSLHPTLRVEIVRNAGSVLDWARSNSVPIFYSAQPGRMSPEERGLLADFWGNGMRTSEEDRAILDEVAPRAGDVILTKWRYSAFFKSDLESRLRAAERDQLVIVGLYVSVGILATALDSYTRDIQPFVVADAVADFSLNSHSNALDYAARHCARVVATAEVAEHV